MFNLDKKYIIAIDGGAASGKSSLAKELAKTLNILYIDTGSMYRAITLYFIENGIEITEENAKKYINDIYVELKYENYNTKVLLNGEDVSLKIRDNIISINTSKLSKIGIVRDNMVKKQRELAKNKSIVMDGRDIGTVVFPNADLKLFLVATYEERAKRRQNDLKKLGKFEELDVLKEELKRRDIEDTTREISPLKKADGAIEIDTTGNTLVETLNEVLDILRKRVGDSDKGNS